MTKYVSYNYTLNASSSETLGWASGDWAEAINTAMDGVVDSLKKKYEGSRNGIKSENSPMYFYRNYNYDSIVSYDRWIVTDLNGAYLEDIIIYFKTSNGSTNWYCPKSFGNVPCKSFSHEFSFTPDTGGSLPKPPDPPFEPPTPTTPGEIGEVPFYEELKKTHDLLALDGLSEEEWDYLKAMQQKNEIMTINKLMEESKKDYMTALGAGAYENVTIAHDPDDPVSTAFYTDNGLDQSLIYNTNLSSVGLGYKDIDGNYKKMETVLNFNKIQQIDDNTYSQMMTESEHVAFLGTLGVGALYVGAGALATYSLYMASKNPEATGNVLGRGVNYLAQQKDYLYSGFTNDGNRQKDLVNPNVPTYGGVYDSTLELKGFESLQNGLDLNMPSTGIDLNIPTDTSIGVTAPAWELKLANPTFEFEITKPTFDLDLTLEGKTLPLGMPVGGIELNVAGKSIPMDVGIDTTIGLDTTDATLSLEGFGDLWITFLTNFVQQLVHKNTLSLNETKNLENVLSSHTIEYGENGIRTTEEAVAKWKDLEFKTVSLEKGVEIDKITRDIKAWEGMHSLNLRTDFDGVVDSANNSFNLSQGFLPSILAMGLPEFLREKALSSIRENNVANVMDQIKSTEPDTDNSNDNDKNDILLGIKKIIFPTEAQFTSSLNGDFGDDFKEMASHFLKTGVM